jgi:uncharacterized protein
MISQRTQLLSENLKKLYYEKAADLLFHGWHHIYLTAKKAPEFAEEFPDVDKELVEAAALTHDLNYIVETNSGPEAGERLRAQYLQEAGFNPKEIAYIESVVMEENTATRDANISDAAKALSDADSLFKIMPLTPIIFSSHYIVENRVDIHQWADKIINEQASLMEQGIYFYTKAANEKYLQWAKTDLELVKQVKESLEDPAIKEMLEIAYDLNVI